MRLVDHLASSGDFLFRRRSYLPLLLLPAFFLALLETHRFHGDELVVRGCRICGLLLSLVGLAIRAYAVGTAPEGTSERSTTDPRAARLNTSGAYSVVRHPLYVANSLMALGLALFPASWSLPPMVLLASVLYYERIAAREEQFLEERFGASFREWAARVPAVIPGSSTFAAPAGGMKWKRVLRGEFHGLFVIGSGFFVLDAGQAVLASGRLRFDPFWTGLFVTTGIFFVLMCVLKKYTRALKDDRRGPAPRVLSAGPASDQREF